MSVRVSPAWQKLEQHKQDLERNPVSFSDVSRIVKNDIQVGGLRFNYAFQNTRDETIKLLVNLADQQQVSQWRARMFGGEKINTTENRAVLHTALRQQSEAELEVDGKNIIPAVRHMQARLFDFVDSVRSGVKTGVTGKTFDTIINIGIGGSDLGPRLVVEALACDFKGLRTHFVANVDPFEIKTVLETIDPERTLFVIVSKTFTTQETLLNAHSARRWMIEKLGETCVASHFVAVSVNAKEVTGFGISLSNMFEMWDWVGGRYSVWSSVGLSVALSIGSTAFRRFLDGAAAMDEHFKTAPFERNMPIVAALLGIWNRNFWGSGALAVLPYCERLRNLPRFLQQLDMESNGKSVTREGLFVDYVTGPIIFGECGTVGQHSFHQWLHQGSDIIPCDFVAIAHDDMSKPEHHRVLLANLAAQITTLALGQSEAASPHDVYAGQRPSNLLLLQTLDAFHLGLLIALFEHKVFVQGVIWEINSFDQPGVELGKRMAKVLDSSTASGFKSSETSVVEALFTSFGPL